MRTAISAIARLTWKRIVRGRTLYVSALLVLVPMVVALLTLGRVPEADDRWTAVGELTMRSLVLLAPVLHLAPSINEENEGKTYTYLWSRPVPREALVLGKLAAVTPAVMVAAIVGLALAWLLVGVGPGEVDPALLPRGLLAAAAGVVGASCFAVGIGALFPRHPLVVALAYVFFGEQILPYVTAIQNISTQYHVKMIAALPHTPFESGDIGTSLAGLAVLSALWLGIAIWRVRRLEFGTADG